MCPTCPKTERTAANRGVIVSRRVRHWAVAVESGHVGHVGHENWYQQPSSKPSWDKPQKRVQCVRRVRKPNEPQQTGASLCPGEFGIGLVQSNLDTSDTLDTKIGISSQVLNPHGTNPENVSNVSDVSENRTNRSKPGRHCVQASSALGCCSRIWTRRTRWTRKLVSAAKF